LRQLHVCNLEGLHNFQEFSQLTECLEEAM